MVQKRFSCLYSGAVSTLSPNNYLTLVKLHVFNENQTNRIRPIASRILGKCANSFSTIIQTGCLMCCSMPNIMPFNANGNNYVFQRVLQFDYCTMLTMICNTKRVQKCRDDFKCKMCNSKLWSHDCLLYVYTDSVVD